GHVGALLLASMPPTGLADGFGLEVPYGAPPLGGCRFTPEGGSPAPRDRGLGGRVHRQEGFHQVSRGLGCTEHGAARGTRRTHAVRASKVSDSGKIVQSAVRGLQRDPLSHRHYSDEI